MRAGWINIVLGFLVIVSTWTSGPYAFGARWTAVAGLTVAGALNIILGVYVIRKERRR